MGDRREKSLAEQCACSVSGCRYDLGESRAADPGTSERQTWQVSQFGFQRADAIVVPHRVHGHGVCPPGDADKSARCQRSSHPTFQVPDDGLLNFFVTGGRDATRPWWDDTPEGRCTFGRRSWPFAVHQGDFANGCSHWLAPRHHFAEGMKVPFVAGQGDDDAVSAWQVAQRAGAGGLGVVNNVCADVRWGGKHDGVKVLRAFLA